MPVYYKNQQIGTRRADFLVEGTVSVELKAIIQIEEVHLAQAINYLEAYDLEVGLLINFGAKSLQFKRLTNKSFRQKNQGNPKIK
jgi:GxxExxY protein